MADASGLKKCSYFLVRYVPNTEREEFINIGVLLYCEEDQYLDCLFTDDFRRLKRLHAAADLRFLRELQSYFEQQIQDHENNLAGYLLEMDESFSNLIQLAPARPLLTAHPRAELQNLFARYVGKRRADFPAADTRMRIKQQLGEALRRGMVLSDRRFEKRIPAEQWTEKGDPFQFDFGYRPPEEAGRPNGHLKLIHALSLHRDNDLAHVLANTLRYIRRKEPAELTAVVEAWPAQENKTASHTHRLLTDAEINVRPLVEVDAFVAGIRSELQMRASAV